MSNISLERNTTQQIALNALKNFEYSEYQGVWLNYEKLKTVDEIRRYLALNGAIRSDYPLSQMVHDDPYRFVRICQFIFETGGVQNSYGRFQAPAQLCSVSRPPLHCRQVEALIMKTLFHANVILPNRLLSIFLNVEALRSRQYSYSSNPWVDQVFMLGRMYFLCNSPTRLGSWPLNSPRNAPQNV